MIIEVFFSLANYFLAWVLSLLPADFVVSGFAFSTFDTYFVYIKNFIAQWDFIFPVEFLMKVVALILSLMFIKWTIDLVKYIANLARGSGA
jgi:hypothetical protein